uniref:CarD family transcriptional regulator n=1 Tax=uncultured Deinococcus sp. TaxID=158789 RepID=UPI0025ECC931
MTVAAPNLSKLLPAAPPGNLLLLPQVARAALFAAFPGPAVLLTTADRLGSYATAGVLGAPVTVNPGLRDWDAKHDHVVLDVNTALDLFPARPEDHALNLRVGSSYPREALLSRLERLGYERGEEPGYELRGDTLELRLEPGAGLPPEAESGLWVRAEFFGDELDTLRLLAPGELTGEKAQFFILEPTPEYLTEVKWDATRLELLPGRVFLDSPEFYASSLGILTDTLWPKLAGRKVTSFGRAPLDLPTLDTGLTTLPFYRARLNDLERDVTEWRQAGYRILILVRHDRTAAYLADKLLNTPDIPWLKFARVEEGRVGFLRAGGEGGFAIPEARTVVITEDLIYGFQGGSALRGKRLGGKPVTDALGLHVGDYLIHPEHGIGQFLGLETLTVLGVTRDYLDLEYRGGAHLRVPIEQLPVLRRHPGTTDDPPVLSSFDKKDWAKAKDKARKNAEEVAGKLLVQYAARQVTPG